MGWKERRDLRYDREDERRERRGVSGDSEGVKVLCTAVLYYMYMYMCVCVSLLFGRVGL